MNKAYVDCKTNEVVNPLLTQEDINIINKINNEYEQQCQLEALKPSNEDIKKAEFEILGINLLTELGVI